jgi:N-acetyl-beta-hexosaminidase
MASSNLVDRAGMGLLTVEEVNIVTKEKLETVKISDGYTVLYWTSWKCGIEVVEAIIDKGVDVNQLSPVSIVIIIYNLLFFE